MQDASDRKSSWRGRVLAVQPRIRLLRSYDQRSHSYLGYNLRINGNIGQKEREFTIAVGKSAHAKYEFRTGDLIRGLCEPVPDERLEVAEFYKASKLEVIEQNDKSESAPPWLGVPPELAVYRQRGHRRLDARTYGAKCTACIWGCKMPVEMIIDQWNPSKKKYRFETFCYGPKSCSLYKAGPIRKVPGRKGMIWEEEDWVDEDAVSHRSADQ